MARTTKSDRDKKVRRTLEDVRIREEDHLVKCSMPGKKGMKRKPLTELYVNGANSPKTEKS